MSGFLKADAVAICFCLKGFRYSLWNWWKMETRMMVQILLANIKIACTFSYAMLVTCNKPYVQLGSMLLLKWRYLAGLGYKMT